MLSHLCPHHSLRFMPTHFLPMNPLTTLQVQQILGVNSQSTPWTLGARGQEKEARVCQQSSQPLIKSVRLLPPCWPVWIFLGPGSAMPLHCPECPGSCLASNQSTSLMV